MLVMPNTSVVPLQADSDHLAEVARAVTLHGMSPQSYYVTVPDPGSSTNRGIFQAIRTQDTSLATRQALHMSAIEGMIRRLRNRISASLVRNEVSLETARAMAGSTSTAASAALEDATGDFVAAATGDFATTPAPGDEELPDYDADVPE